MKHLALSGPLSEGWETDEGGKGVGSGQRVHFVGNEENLEMRISGKSDWGAEGFDQS